MRMSAVRDACTRGLVLAPVAALLLSVATLLLGNGLLGTLLIVRAGQEGFSGGTVAAMMSCYFAGFTVGAKIAFQPSPQGAGWMLRNPQGAALAFVPTIEAVDESRTRTL